MKIQRILPVALLALGLGLGSAQAAVVQPYQQAAFTAAQESKKPILIFVEAPWCPTCAKERPILASLYDTPAFKDLQDARMKQYADAKAAFCANKPGFAAITISGSPCEAARYSASSSRIMGRMTG